MRNIVLGNITITSKTKVHEVLPYIYSGRYDDVMEESLLGLKECPFTIASTCFMCLFHYKHLLGISSCITLFENDTSEDILEIKSGYIRDLNRILLLCFKTPLTDINDDIAREEHKMLTVKKFQCSRSFYKTYCEKMDENDPESFVGEKSMGTLCRDENKQLGNEILSLFTPYAKEETDEIPVTF